MDSEKDSRQERGPFQVLRDAADGISIAFSMYSRLPVGRGEWTEGGMRCALCFFPLVGAVLGALMRAAEVLLGYLGAGAVARAAVLTAVPLLVTGGIHMDGFLDTADARSSWQPKERRLEILKDPHTGAFAVVHGMIYLLLMTAVISELTGAAFAAAGGVFVMSRACSGWSVVSFPKARAGLAQTFSAQAGRRLVQVSMTVWAIAAATWMMAHAGAVSGGAAVVAAILTAVWYYRMAMREFGGITGDLAGYFLQVCELVMLGVLAVG